jgi:uncharacterized RDD family membrane protein YckC
MERYYAEILDIDIGWHLRETVLTSRYIRLVNFMIDYLAIYCLATMVGIFVGYISATEYLFFNSHQFNPFLDYVIITSTSLLYFSTEYFFNGKSLGKFLTQTRVVHNIEPEISFKVYLLRSLWRLVPIDVLSFLPVHNDCWHDRFSDTRVVNDG